MDIITASYLKHFVDDSIAGIDGVLAGKNCKIQSVEDITNGHRITFSWNDDEGVARTSVLDVMDGNGIEDVDIKYASSSSGTTPPETGWQSSVPEVPDGYYLWTRNISTYANGDEKITYVVGRQGVDGVSPTVIVTDITGGHRVVITDGTGQHPFNVMDGLAIDHIEVEYAEGSSGTSAPPTGWQSTPPVVATGNYLWTKNTTYLKDGTNSVAYLVGLQGAAGISPTVSVTPVSEGTRVVITDKDGPHPFTVEDGEDGTDGRDGADGADGFSPIITTEKVEKTTTITIVDATGTKYATVLDGVDGKTITNITINAQNHVIVSYSDGTSSDAGELIVQSAVMSVNGETGNVVLSLPDVVNVGANLSYDSTTNTLSSTATGLQSDWNQTDTTAEDYIKNKPDIPAMQLQSDWNQTDNTKKDYIKNKPTLGTAASKDVPSSGNATTTQVVLGSDTRLSDARNAADVCSWAKAATKPSYTASEVGAIPSTYAPSAASAENQLADKCFVNSSIETATATFRGTYNSIAELNAYSGAKDNNDYAFVKTLDSSSGLYQYDRYKWVPGNPGEWVYEYTINSSGFTQAQLDALNSGITSTCYCGNVSCFGGCTYACAKADIRSGLTDCVGTVTQVKVGSTAYNPTTGVVSLPAYPPDLSNCAGLKCTGTIPDLGTGTVASARPIAFQGYDTELIPNCLVLNSNFTYNPGTGVLRAQYINAINSFTSNPPTAANQNCCLVIAPTCCNDSAKSTTCWCFYGSGVLCNCGSIMTGYCVNVASPANTRTYIRVKFGSVNANAIAQIYNSQARIAKSDSASYAVYLGGDYGGLNYAHLGTEASPSTCMWLSFNGFRPMNIFSNTPVSIDCCTKTAPSGITFTAVPNLTASTGTLSSVNVSVNGTSGTAITSDGTVVLTNVKGCTCLGAAGAVDCNRPVMLPSIGTGNVIEQNGNFAYSTVLTYNTCRNILSNNCSVTFYINKPDNSGNPSYAILYDITNWYNGTTGIGTKGFTGIVNIQRSGGYTIANTEFIDFSAGWGRNGQDINSASYLCLTYGPYTDNAAIPVVIKCTSNGVTCYFFAVRVLQAASFLSFHGITISTPYTSWWVNTTNSSGTLPTGWEVLRFGALTGSILCATSATCLGTRNCAQYFWNCAGSDLGNNITGNISYMSCTLSGIGTGWRFNIAQQWSSGNHWRSNLSIPTYHSSNTHAAYRCADSDGNYQSWRELIDNSGGQTINGFLTATAFCSCVNANCWFKADVTGIQYCCHNTDNIDFDVTLSQLGLNVYCENHGNYKCSCISNDYISIENYYCRTELSSSSLYLCRNQGSAKEGYITPEYICLDNGNLIFCNTLLCAGGVTIASRNSSDNQWNFNGSACNAICACSVITHNNYCMDYFCGSADRPVMVTTAATSSHTTTTATIGRSTACPLTFNPATGNLCTTQFVANGYPLKYRQTVNLTGLSTSCFYPIVWNGSGIYESDIEIQSPGYMGSCPYNMNYIHFFERSNGWGDMPKTLYIQNLSRYDNNENLIGCIGYATTDGVYSAIWLRGGYAYYVSANVLLCAKTTDFTYCQSKFTVGTTYCGGTNTCVQVFSYNTTARSNILGTLYADTVCSSSGILTTCTGTVTQVKVGTIAYNPSSGVISLPAYPTGTLSSVNVSVNGTSGTAITSNGTVTLTNVYGCVNTTTYPGACCTGTVTVSNVNADTYYDVALCTGATSIGKSCGTYGVSFNPNTGVLNANIFQGVLIRCWNRTSTPTVTRLTSSTAACNMNHYCTCYDSVKHEFYTVLCLPSNVCQAAGKVFYGYVNYNTVLVPEAQTVSLSFQGAHTVSGCTWTSTSCIVGAGYEGYAFASGTCVIFGIYNRNDSTNMWGLRVMIHGVY